MAVFHYILYKLTQKHEHYELHLYLNLTIVNVFVVVVE